MVTTPIIIGLSSVIVALIVESIIYIFDGAWRIRRNIAWLALMLNAFGTGILVSERLSSLTVILLLLVVYRSVNILIIYQGTLPTEHLRSVISKNFRYLALSTAVLAMIWAIVNGFDIRIGSHACYLAGSIALLMVSLALLFITFANIIKTKVKQSALLNDDKIPTLTLAIPARNENEQLAECLEAILASDYPKMEVIVYDDCSQDKTATIIKSFAHEGVRFVKGEKAKDDWLAKNLACQKLFDEATGEIILYAGVDVRFEPRTISRLVEYLENNKLEMLSVLPKRVRGGIMAAFFQPMRYWWELALPKWLFKQPPVLSTCWLIKRSVLQKIGGFKAVTRAIIPEEHFAQQTNATKTYAFIRSNGLIGLTTQKDFVSQWLTAVRTRYPQSHHNLARIAAKTLLMLVFLLLPFVAFILSLSLSAPLTVIIITGLSALALITGHVLITFISNPSAALFALVNFPLVVLLDIVAMHISMYRYEFGEVIWKGRNVSNPALRVIDHLPKV